MESIVKYFERITKLKAIPEQIEVLEALANPSIKNLCLSCGRGFSKTLLSALAALWYADIYSKEIGKPLEILLVSSQQRIYFHLNNFFHDNPELAERLAQKGIFKAIPVEGFQLVDTRSIVDTAVPTAGSVRSHRADIVFVDEAHLIKDEIFERDILPVLTGDLCKLVILSTPSSNKGFFINIVKNADKENFVLKQFSSEVCSWQKINNERLKKRLTPEGYKREVLAQIPSKEEMMFFDTYDIDKCLVKCPSTPVRTPDARITIGID